VSVGGCGLEGSREKRYWDIWGCSSASASAGFWSALASCNDEMIKHDNEEHLIDVGLGGCSEWGHWYRGDVR